MHQFEILLLDLIVVMAMAPLARQLGAPLPVALVLAGFALGLIPRFPALDIAPDLVFLIFVPPLLYWSCITSPLRELRRERATIAMLAVGAVIATMLGVGVVAHLLPPRLPWAPAFVLAAVVAPPDAAVTIAIARRLGIPRRLAAVLEGETLFNDVAAFTGYKLAVAATVTGVFTFGDAAGHVVRHGIGGIAIGWAVARLVMWLRRRIRDPVVSSTLSLLTAFAAYLPAEWLGTSGVLAVVTTGLLLAKVAPQIVDASTRMQAQSVWSVVLFLLNGLIFLLIGLQIGTLGRELAANGEMALLLPIAVVSIAVIAVRVAWVLGAAALQRLVVRGAKAAALPPWRSAVFLAWTGIRGGDTLVTAAAIPLVLANGDAFAGRRVIVVVAFGVILVTLIVQGLTLRKIIGTCSAHEDQDEIEEERIARHALAEAGGARLEEIAASEGIPEEVVGQIRTHHHLRRHVRSGSESQPENLGSSVLGASLLRINQEVLRAERRSVIDLRDRQSISDEVLRRIQRELDLEELVMLRLSEG